MVSHTKSIVKNSIAILSLKITLPISFFILAISIARILGPEEFGKYSLVLAIYCIFELISFLGLDNLVIREIAKEPANASRFLSNGILLGFFSTSICFLLMSIFSNVMGYSYDIKKAIYIIGFVLLPTFVNSLSEAIFIALEKAKYAFFVSFIRDLFMVSGGIFFLFRYHSIYLVLITIIIVRFLSSFFFVYLLIRHNIKLSLKIDFTFIHNIARIISTFVLIAILANIFLEIDIIILSKIRDMAEVGFYSVAKKFMKMGFLFIFSFVTALFPIISKTFKLSKDTFYKLCSMIFKYTLMFIFPIIIAINFLSSDVIFLFFGKDFVASVIILRILIWSLIPLSMIFLQSRILIAADHQNKDLCALAIGLIISVTLIITLTLKWGYFGTSLAVLISTVTSSILYCYMVSKYVFKFSYLFLISRPFLAAISMAIFLFFLRKENPYLITPISILLYFGVLVILKTFVKEDLNFLYTVHKQKDSISDLRE